MKRHNWKLFAAHLMLAFCTFALLCGGKRNEQRAVLKPFQKMAKKYDFTISAEPLKGSVTGTLLPIDEQAPQLEAFFAILDTLPPKLVKQSSLNKVQIVRDLKLQGKPCGGVASLSDHKIVVTSPVSAHTVYHELFHIFDKLDDNDWKALNHPAFAYQGSEYYPANYSKREKKKILKKHEQYGISDFSKDFATAYARSNSGEDRAETFASLLAGGPNFLAKARQSKVLYRKCCRIIRWSVKNALLDEAFWAKHLKLSPAAVLQLVNDGK